jgi:hypothetical protein
MSPDVLVASCPSYGSQYLKSAAHDEVAERRAIADDG